MAEPEDSDLATRARAADPNQPGPTAKIIDFLTGPEAADASDDELKEAAKQLGLDPESIRIMRDIRLQRKSPAEIEADIDRVFGAAEGDHPSVEELTYRAAFLDINAAAAAKKTQAERDRAVSRLNAHAVTDNRNILAAARKAAGAFTLYRGRTARQKGQQIVKSIEGMKTTIGACSPTISSA